VRRTRTADFGSCVAVRNSRLFNFSTTQSGKQHGRLSGNSADIHALRNGSLDCRTVRDRRAKPDSKAGGRLVSNVAYVRNVQA
jgi:hypothetical protein